MDHQALRILRLLEEIEKDETPSQRDLSRKLDMSLGLVNSFVKRLAQKGYCKITTIPKNRVKYLLTPKGAVEKTRLTYEYIQSSISYYQNSLHKINKLFSILIKEGVRKIVFYGASDLAEISYFLMQETPLELVAIVDDSHCGGTFIKMNVDESNQLAHTTFDRILITDITQPLKSYDTIMAQGIPTDKIVMI